MGWKLEGIWVEEGGVWVEGRECGEEKWVEGRVGGRKSGCIGGFGEHFIGLEEDI